MRVQTLDGSNTDLHPDTIDALRSRLQGLVLTPHDEGYTAARQLWNGMTDRRPALIARALGQADVIEVVRFAREHGLPVSIKGGGHNIAGLAAADGALMVDLSLMRGVWVDPHRRIAHAQAGALLGDVDRETQMHGLAAVLGFVSQTGIAGLTLGGGFGYLTRRWGWTVDNVVGMDLVSADAEPVRASADENPDLFWGLRGGGGNFGVVMGIDYRLHRVGPEVVGGIVAWPGEQAADVLALYRTLTEEAPPELTLAAFLRLAPPAPWLPSHVHGSPIAAILACYSGDPDVGERVVAPIKTFGEPLGDMLVRRPYTQLQSLLDATQPKGRRYYWKSEYLPRIEPSLCDIAIEQATRITSPHSAVIFFHIGGALNTREDEYAAVGNRDARYVLNITGAWEDAAEDARHTAWVREAWHAMKPFSTGGTYVNFLTEDEPEDRTVAALGSALPRLVDIKSRWDPDNVFRFNRNVMPTGHGVHPVRE